MSPDHQRSRITPDRRPDDLVAQFGKLVGERMRLEQVLPGGRALQLIRSDGAGFVLKWDTDAGSIRRRRQAIATAQRLGNEAGWPVPGFDLVEDDSILFVRQSLMAGAELAHLATPVVARMSELIDATAGLGCGQPNNWPHRLHDTLLAEPVEPQDYVSHDLLRAHSTAGQQLIDRIEAIGDDLDPADLGPADDLMHWDLHPGNVLVDGDVVTAIIDLDNAAPGPRQFDLITLALSVQIIPGDADVHRRLLDHAREQSTEALWVASVAHLVLRFANWGLRTGHVEEAEFWIEEGHRRLGDAH